MSGIITPRTLKGFRDYLPEAAIPRERIIDVAKRVYRSYGYAPIDTPALEYTEILLGKGGEETDKQTYTFTDQGGRQVSMRFDLTVPLARFVAQHIGTLGTPFKRYHVGPVWRGENTQRGRYREFVQCDFDTIGTESVVADIETGLVIHDTLTGIGFDAFTLHLNDRRVLTGILQRLDLASSSAAVLRALDKLSRFGAEAVVNEMVEHAGATPAQAQELLKLAEVEGGNAERLAALAPLVAGVEIGELGIERLGQVLEGVAAAGVPERRILLNPSVARGLDYYTGTVYETTLDDLPGIGSVCSGGRYDDLASLYTKERLPGIGASLGVDRLLAAMEELGLLEAVRTPAPVFLPYFAEGRLTDYLSLAASLRSAGLAVEFYPEPRKLGAQLKYADRRGHRVAVIVGDREWEAGTCEVKDLASGSSTPVTLDEVAAAIRDILDPQ